MKTLFAVKDVDRRFYEKHIAGWLPAELVDIHTHIYQKWLRQLKARIRARSGKPVMVSWPSRVTDQNPVEHLLETYRLLFPGKKVVPLVFGSPVADARALERVNNYVMRAAGKYRLPSLLFSHPGWSGQELAQKIRAGRFVGVKGYLSLAPKYLPAAEVRIFDFFPQHQLEMLDRLGQIVMLHIPRNARLRDPVNLAQMLEIEERYPKLHLIVAHVGRAYCPEDLGDAFKVLAKTKRMLFDISANANALVFRQLLETVGAKRVLFGSDMPILRMRARRICEQGHYVNLVPKGLYGDVSGDKHMRELSGSDAEKVTFFIYEELAAFGRVARALGLNAADIKNVFCGNARRILAQAGFRQ